MEGNTGLIAALSALIGAGLPIICKFLLDFLGVKKQSQRDERSDVWAEAQKIRADLQGQLLETRGSILTLQEANLKYIIENTELKTRMRDLETKVAALSVEVEACHKRAEAVESERDKLIAERDLLKGAISSQLDRLAAIITRLDPSQTSHDVNAAMQSVRDLNSGQTTPPPAVAAS